VLALAACTAPLQAAQIVSTAKPSSAAPPADCRPVTPFVPAHFPRRPAIKNPLLPLVPGTKTVMSGTVADDNGTSHSHQIVATVSGVAKVLDGVRTLVVFERDIQDGVLQESELAFEAQDTRGTLWNVGEYPEEYDGGRLAGAPSTWIGGIAGAHPGVNMLSRPRVGIPAYLQGVAPAVEFRDCALVTSVKAKICLPGHCYRDVLVTDEWAPLDPDGGHQLKYYARGVGPIQVGAVGGTSQEVLRLTSRSRLSRAALARVDADVLEQDRRGYRVSPRVYGRTPVATLLARGDD
jgi:hypothetical protein